MPVAARVWTEGLSPISFDQKKLGNTHLSMEYPKRNTELSETPTQSANDRMYQLIRGSYNFCEDGHGMHLL